MNNRILSMLSLAAKAGKVSSGGFSVEKQIKTGEAFLVILSEDASGNTKKKFKDSCEFYGVPVYEFADSETLGHYIGKEFRKVLAVTDQGFADNIIDKLSNKQSMEVNE